MKKKKMLQRAIALFCTMNMLGGSILQESGISFFADKVYAADDEEGVSENSGSGETEVSGNMADEVSGNEAAASGNEAAPEETQEEDPAGDDAVVSGDDENDDNAGGNEEENAAGEDVIINDGDAVYYADEEGNLITVEYPETEVVSLSKSQLDMFYMFGEDKDDPEGLKLSLTDDFKAALNSESGSLTAGDYTWKRRSVAGSRYLIYNSRWEDL